MFWSRWNPQCPLASPALACAGRLHQELSAGSLSLRFTVGPFLSSAVTLSPHRPAGPSCCRAASWELLFVSVSPESKQRHWSRAGGQRAPERGTGDSVTRHTPAPGDDRALLMPPAQGRASKQLPHAGSTFRCLRERTSQACLSCLRLLYQMLLLPAPPPPALPWLPQASLCACCVPALPPRTATSLHLFQPLLVTVLSSHPGHHGKGRPGPVAKL